MALGIDEKEAAADSGISPSGWSNYETGIRLCDPLVMARFCSKYGITLDWIYLENASGIRTDLRRKLLAYYRTTRGTNTQSE